MPVPVLPLGGFDGEIGDSNLVDSSLGPMMLRRCAFSGKVYGVPRIGWDTRYLWDRSRGGSTKSPFWRDNYGLGREFYTGSVVEWCLGLDQRLGSAGRFGL